MVSGPLAVYAAEPTPPTQYQIPAMSLREALTNLAEIARISIAYNGANIENYRSGYVLNAANTADALEIILSRTPFSFEFTGDHTVKLIPRVADHVKQMAPAKTPTAQPDLILVTATKREAYTQKLPVSISTIDGRTLSRWGMRNFNALAPKLAGVSFTNLGPSRNKIFLRGISDGAFADRTQSTVGVYLDETRVIFNDTNPDIRLIDLERIEVVRGPQGTLYGDGSVGGIYRIITKKPALDEYAGYLRASGSVTEGGGSNGTIDGAINLPLAPDRFGLRISGYRESASGYIDNVGTGEENINDSNIFGGRVAGRLKLAENWTLDGAANLQTVDLADSQYIFSNLGGLRRATSAREPYRDDIKIYSLTLRGDIAGARITSSTAFVQRDVKTTFDATAALPVLINDTSAEGFFETSSNIETFTHETRIVSDQDGDFDWLAGVFVARRDEKLFSRLITNNLTPTELAFFSNRNDGVDETALFGEASVYILDKVKFTAGLRWSRTEYDIDVASGGIANTGVDGLVNSRKRSSFSPKIAISYQYSDDILFYTQASQGSRIGGFNVNTPLEAITDLGPNDSVTVFESDTLWNTEIGLKSSWLDNNVIFNAAVFYVFWTEIQTDQILPSGFSFITNAGQARNLGVEAELTARPFPNVELSSAFFWNNPELTEANPFLGADAGDKLPNIAALSASAGATIEFPIAGKWNGLLAADYSYVGESFLTFAEDIAPTMGDYHVGNVRLTAQLNNLRTGVYVDNVWNTRGNTFAFGNPFSLANQPQETPLRPRTIGVFLEKQF
ncbi:TonB-dependent receptor [hydrothermal vent metagenome]|uniref:TonB-dependent receptor n=1 Tax=hydrothermal vent metagenome TaxID=652676 RepID=A0A3B0SMB7_9ZZZZ